MDVGSRAKYVNRDTLLISPEKPMPARDGEKA